MVRIYIVLWLVLLLSILNVNANESVPSYVSDAVPESIVLGEGRLKVLFWDVYDATLYTPAKGYSSEAPFALSLTYLMDFAGKDIAKRSIDEMKDQDWQDDAQLAQWETQMLATFPDVKENDTLIGIQNEEGSAIFYYNDTFVAQIDDPEFSRAFFGIWLSNKTSEPKLRRKLLGEYQ